MIEISIQLNSSQSTTYETNSEKLLNQGLQILYFSST